MSVHCYPTATMRPVYSIHMEGSQKECVCALTTLLGALKRREDVALNDGCSIECTNRGAKIHRRLHSAFYSQMEQLPITNYHNHITLTQLILKIQSDQA